MFYGSNIAAAKTCDHKHCLSNVLSIVSSLHTSPNFNTPACIEDAEEELQIATGNRLPAFQAIPPNRLNLN